MSIILVRHGETALNRARVLQPADTPLSELGLQQAEAVARRLLSLRPAGLISSDLPRAMRTAEAIAQASGLPLESSALLQERNYGDLRGRAYDGLGFDPLTMAHAPPGGESARAFEWRMARAFAMLVARRKALAGPLVVVTHGLVIRATLLGLADSAAAPLDGAPIGNTALTILAARPPHRVELLNSTLHLDITTQADPRGLVGG